MDDKTAAIVIIGNEILNGCVHDSNSHFLCRELFQLGVKVERILTIPDSEEIIADEIRHVSDTYDYVFVSGGIGPTHDDVTLSSIARAFDRDITFEQKLEDIFRTRFGENFDPGWLKMANIPEGTELVGGDEMVFPVLKVENVFIFPGIPKILSRKFKTICELFRSTPFCQKNVEVSTNEARLVPILDRVVHQFPDVQIGSYPAVEGREGVRLCIESKAEARVEEAFLFLNSLLKFDSLI